MITNRAAAKRTNCQATGLTYATGFRDRRLSVIGVGLPYNGFMTEGPARFQIKLRNVFVATFWVGIACATATMMSGVWRWEAVAPIWGFLTVFSLLTAFWSLRGRYFNVLVTVIYAALFFLLLFWFYRPALLG